MVIINSNDNKLKSKAIPIFKKEIIEKPSESFVKKAQKELVDLGFKAQAFPREINLFYLGENFRDRIEYKEGIYHVLNQNIQFTEEEILKDLAANPENYSPNVVMRPLYQELILPNLAYIGGGGELAYWLERKEQFAHFDVSYPMLIRRDSVLWIDKGSQKKMTKLGLSLNDIWENEVKLIKNHVKEIMDEENYISNEINVFKSNYEDLIQKINQIDPSLSKAAAAEMTKAINGLNNLQSKIIRAEKKKNEVSINQIKGLKEKLFPRGSLQERKDNFIPLYLKHGTDFFNALYQCLDPLDNRVKVIMPS